MPGFKGINKMSVPLKNVCWYILFRMSEYIPWTQEMFNEVVRREPNALELIPDRFKMQEISNEVVEENPYTLWHVPDPLITQEMRAGVLLKYLFSLAFVPDSYKTQEM